MPLLLLALTGLYTYVVLDIEYTGIGYMINGLRTLKTTSIIAMWLVMGFILYEKVETFNPRYILLLIPLFYFCITINYSFVGDQIVSYYPWLIFGKIEEFALFIGGAIIAAIMQYLLKGTDNFKPTYPIILFYAPIFFFVIPYFIVGGIASLFQDSNINLDFPSNVIFPSFGEWSGGSIIIAGFIFSFYLGIRIMDPSVNVLFTKIRFFRIFISEDAVKKVGKWDYVKFIVELFIAFTTVSAAFAFSGIGLTDGFPPVVFLPSEIVPISFLGVIPFLLFVARKGIFGEKNQITNL